MFFWNSCFFDDPVDVGSLISVPLPFLNPAWTSGSSRFTYCRSLAWRILSITLIASEMSNYAVAWTFFGIAFLWGWNENWPFPVLWLLLSFPNLLAYWVQHFHSIIFQDLKQFNWNTITSTNFVQWCFLRPTWLHIPGCLVIGEWSHHHGCLGHEDLFLYSSSVYFCHLFLISSASVRSMPFLSFIVPIFAQVLPWYHSFSWREL